MATLAPVRVPFGVLDATKLRSFSNIKNVQNATPVTLSKPVKRSHAASTFDDFDFENIDPTTYNSPNKKAKNVPEYPFKPTKAAQFVLRKTTSTTTRPVITPRRLNASKVAPTVAPIRTQPASAPVGGRSPKSKRAGILSRRRVSSPFTRVDPPAFGLSNGLPFSIDAALSGTVSSHKLETRQSQHTTLQNTTPMGWHFEIYEESDIVQDIDQTAQHTSFIAISDDDDSDVERSRTPEDARGKENVPPADYMMRASNRPTLVPVSRKNMMTDEPRSPLGDLNAADYYAEGCDAASVIIVPSEDDNEKNAYGEIACSSTPLDDYSLASSARRRSDAVNEIDCGWKGVLASMGDRKKVGSEDAVEEEAAEIEIWESESAKAERGRSPEIFTNPTDPDGAIAPLSL
ncbi:MAG: hypothetical protein MMC33_004051 [Icmadophila ericetorum]|nr:hypothetical protein [Icmadophila ericetorum]